MIDGPPVLAVEILSPNDTQKEVHAKIADYLASGVAVVWVVDPIFQTVTVYRPQQKTAFFTDADELTAEPELPGFRARVSQFFE